LREGFSAWLLEDASRPLSDDDFEKVKQELPEAVIGSEQIG
jgi:hypothetical protein